MKHILVIEQYLPTHQVYAEKYSIVISENEITFPDLNGSINKFLNSVPSISFLITQGVTIPDGWTYYKSALKPVPSSPDVTLPVNDQLSPDAEPVPGDYEIRCKIISQL
jgi:hypothetical protein